MQGLALVSVLVVATAALVASLSWVCVGPARLRAARKRPQWLRERARSVAPHVGVLAGVLVINKGLQGWIERISHAYGIDATPMLAGLEGDLIVRVQGLVPDLAMGYFAAAYVLGYAAILVVPVVCYAIAERTRPLRVLVSAYAINYAVAVVCYTALVAYGPRNADRASSGESADGVLIELVPDITTVTALINTNTNVFPSLHTSLSVTVFALAWLTRDEFPRWLAVSGVLAASIVLSTMALGIHWASDVLAGIGLAVFAVGVADRVVGT